VRRRSFVAAALVAAFVVACAGDASEPRTAPPSASTTTATTTPELARVLVLGDSNTVLAQQDVESALRAAGLEPSVHALAGYGLKDLDFWLDALPALLDDDPALVVVALGTNDALEATDAAAFRERLDRMMSELGDRSVVWVAHHEGRPEPEGTNARTVNAAVREAPSRWPSLTVVDLAPLLAADASLLDVDAVHFSETGRPWFAQQLAAAASAAVRGS
jgi:lysophospholipase L1-like esterase